MIRLRETIEVARPIDEVFAYVSNFGNAAQWDPGVADSRKAGAGAIGVGTAFELQVRFGPRSIPMMYVVREYDPPKRVLLEGKGDSVHALDDIGFAATPRGTRITYTADISLLGASRIAGSAAPLYSPMCSKSASTWILSSRPRR